MSLGGYDNTLEVSDAVEAYDPETRVWSVVHGSVSIFCQFTLQTPAGGCDFELNSGSNDVDEGHHRLPQNSKELQ